MVGRRLIVLLLLLATTPGIPSQSRGLSIEMPLAIAYQPRGFREVPTVAYPSEAEVKNDLTLLRGAGFRGLVTYGAMDVLARVPRLARDAGFDRLVVMGVWNPNSGDELENALAQAELVDGYSVGNEGLGKRYSRQELAAAMSRLRTQSGKPVTTSERMERYVASADAKWLIDNSDWIFPIAHPYWHGYREPRAASRWLISQYDYLTVTSGKRVILKEVGLPTKGDSCCDERSQVELFERTSRAGVEFFFFEAFDQPFKAGAAVEGHWGLYRADGSRKAAIDWLQNARQSRER
jgi:exo-beta-1,3-glucanase (GH17 family)